MAEHGGRFPTSAAQLVQLPGIGRSTAAAIAAFCFGERAAILDGNVKRVLARVLAFDGNLAEPASLRSLWAHAESLLPEDAVDVYTQGLMDLGADVCLARAPRRRPRQDRRGSAAAASGTPTHFPMKRAPLRRGRREHVWLWLTWREQLWLLPRPSRGIWAGLWSLPEFEAVGDDFARVTAAWPGACERLPSFTHALTHLDWTLHPRRWQVPWTLPAERLGEITANWPEGRWFDRDAALALGLPAPLRRLLSAPVREAIEAG